MNKFLMLFLLALTGAITLFVGQAFAAVPHEWGIGFQDSVSPVMDRIISFHHMMLWIISAIVVFVLALLIYVIVRFNERANPTPSKTTHNVPLEVVWTVIPVLILIIIVIPSLKLLYYTDRVEKPDMTLKVTGYQWYWGYEYPDQGGVNFLANRLPDKDLKKERGDIRLLTTDNPVVVPVDTNIQVLVTAADVIHAFALPAAGVKKDAVPGRLNETWMRINKPGTYYGQCSELCGKDHGFMPIEVKAVTKAEFDTWIAAKKKEQGIADKPAAAAVPAAHNE